MKAGVRAGFRALLLLALLPLAGCASYSDAFAIIERDLAARQYDAALLNIEQQAESKNGRVLYLLNKGMVLRMKGDFVDSNQTLEAAKLEMERLYAVSVSENALSFIINDATVSYAGEDYEQVLVHLYLALNYLELGQLSAARVEALQVDIKLREIGETIPDSRYTEDALSRYLTGMIYEELGEWSDAMIAYRKAYEAYKKYQVLYAMPMPEMLKQDLLRLTQRQGLKDELAQYRKEFGIEPLPIAENRAELEGELVFVLNNGLAPIKKEKSIGAWVPSTSGMAHNSNASRPAAVGMPVLVQIALPYYQSRPNNVLSARVSVTGKQARTQLMENIDAIAKSSLDARMAAITARSIARAVAKGALQNAVDRSANHDRDPAAALISSFIVRVAAVATERADTRSWLTLPANIQLARLSLQPGSYDVTIEMLGENDRVIETREFSQVLIRQAHKTYLTQHWVPPHHSATGSRP